MDSTWAIVVAAGLGVRLSADKPKAFVSVGGCSLVQRCVSGLKDSGMIDRVVVVVHQDWINVAEEMFPSDCVVIGGRDRHDSVRAGLSAIPSEVRHVLVHDAARAFTPVDIIRSVVETLKSGALAVVPVLPVVDTIKRVDFSNHVVATVDRSVLRVAQTPQGFAVKTFREAYEKWDNENHLTADFIPTDDSSLMERMHVPVVTIPGSRLAGKITVPEDVEWMEMWLRKGTEHEGGDRG